MSTEHEMARPDWLLDGCSDDSPRVLVVDDDDMVLESVYDVLAERYDCDAAPSAADAMRLLAARRHHVVITDLMMPEVNGTALLQQLKEVCPTSMGIVMTGYGSKEAAISALKAGAFDFLEKPLAPVLLRQSVGRAWRAVRAELRNRALTSELRRTNEDLRREIANRKRLETELLQTHKLEALGRLAAGIAHEINTPLQFIRDNVSFLQDVFGDLLRPNANGSDALDQQLQLRQRGGADDLHARQAAHSVAQIYDAFADTTAGLSQLTDLVAAMRDFSHPGAEEKTPVDLNHVVSNMITVARTEWKSVAEVTTDLADDIPPVLAFPGALSQALLNIIINAAQAISDAVGTSGNKGSIHIRTRSQGQSSVTIVVSDSGSGIAENIRRQIFDPFFTTKEVGRGTGQGLAIAHSIISGKHQGTIGVESTPGVGSTFTIVLPTDGRSPRQGSIS